LRDSNTHGVIVIVTDVRTSDLEQRNNNNNNNVLEDNFKLYWNRSIITAKIIPSKRPDITLMNKKQRTLF